MNKIDKTWKTGDILTSNDMNTLVGAVNDLVTDKQDIIEDQDTIRSNSKKCPQLFQKSQISNYINNSEMESTYAKTADIDRDINELQNKISDWDTIEANAKKNTTAVQSADISDMLTKTVASSTYASKADLTTMTNAVNGILSPSEAEDLDYVVVNKVSTGIGSGPVRMSRQTFSNEVNLQTHAWGFTMNALMKGCDLPALGNYDLLDNYKSQVGRYLVTKTGKAIKLDKSDSTKTIDGVAFSADDGDVFVRLPKFYYKVVQTSDDVSNIWMSAQDIGGHEFPEQWLGAYIGHKDDSGALRSIAGVVPTGYWSGNTAWAAAQVNGKEYGLYDYDAWRMITMLLLSDRRYTNVRYNIGSGCGGYLNDTTNWPKTKTEITGRTSSLGDSTGFIKFSDIGITTDVADTGHVSYLGIEDLWGWLWQIIQGIYERSGALYAYKGNRLPTSSELSSVPTGEYRMFALKHYNGNSFSNKYLLGEYFDTVISSEDSKYGAVASYGWCTKSFNQSHFQMMDVGGDAGEWENAPWRYQISRSFGSADNWGDLGCRLAYYGTPEIVSNYADLKS